MTNIEMVATGSGDAGADEAVEYFWYDGRVVGRRRRMPYPTIYELYLNGWVERPVMDWDTNATPLTEKEAAMWIKRNTSK
jgi:hypothetical protein